MCYICMKASFSKLLHVHYRTFSFCKETMGKVKFVVIGSCYHTLFLPETLRRYPEAIYKPFKFDGIFLWIYTSFHIQYKLPGDDIKCFWLYDYGAFKWGRWRLDLSTFISNRLLSIVVQNKALTKWFDGENEKPSWMHKMDRERFYGRTKLLIAF